MESACYIYYSVVIIIYAVLSFMSHLAKPPPLKPLMANGLTIFRLPEPPLMVMCKAHEHAKHATLGGSGACPPGNFEILHSLRLNLRAF